MGKERSSGRHTDGHGHPDARRDPDGDGVGGQERTDAQPRTAWSRRYGWSEKAYTYMNDARMNDARCPRRHSPIGRLGARRELVLTAESARRRRTRARGSL